VIVNLWERLLDLAALATIGGALAIVLGAYGWGIALLAVVAVLFITPIRRTGLGAAVAIGRMAGRRWDAPRDVAFDRLARSETWFAGLMSSILIWLLPGVGFWIVAHAWPYPFSLAQAEYAYATSASLGGLVLSPGGVLVAGTRLLEVLQDAQFPSAPAALTVLGIRLATAGVATILGGLFVLLHLRSPRPVEALHFDEIADAYDVQIPEARRTALLTRKTTLMREALERTAPKGRGLDAGCGQGTYVARMRELGFDVYGIDMSAGQVQIAERNVGGQGLVTTGSLLQIPARDGEYDFAYAINVLHHLSSIDEQRRAFAELLRVLKPGGLLFVHEINTRNLLFRFYMGYVFPSLNCIDEGVERWLLPHELRVYTDVPVIDIRYFTFLPEFLPEPLVQILAPVERLLEVSPLRIYSAHYMAVLQKGGSQVSGGGPRVG
jgi:SAM-dependent methyltransferase